MIKKLGNRNVKSIQHLADKNIIEYDDETVIYKRNIGGIITKHSRPNTKKQQTLGWMEHEKNFFQKYCKVEKIEQVIQAIVEKIGLR